MGVAFVLALLFQPAAPPSSQPLPAGARPSVITMPDWVRRPSGEDVGRYYPQAALQRNLGGRAVISCSVTAEGLLIDCKVVEETPTGVGFGEAAVKLGALFKMRPMTRDGVPVPGGVVRIPMIFAIPGGAPDPITPTLRCYGATAAEAELHPDNKDAIGAFGMYAAQVAIREAQASATPQALEQALVGARLSATASAGQAGQRATLKACLDFYHQRAPPGLQP